MRGWIFKLVLAFIVLFTLTSIRANATICYSANSGNWEDPSCWVSGSVPVCGDTIVICSGHTVTVTTNNSTLYSGSAVVIQVYGTLSFGNGKKLNLSCGSEVNLMAGPPAGKIQGFGGGGSSNQLNICNQNVWSAEDGPQSGPQTFAAPPPLPVELVSFTSQIKGRQLALQWITASEINNSHFIIERSNDGTTFRAVAKLDGKGTSSAMNYYSYNEQITFERVYFRLRQVDYNGGFNFSDVLSVDVGVKSLSVFPNPAKEKLFISGATGEHYRCKLMNSRGVSIIETTGIKGEFDLSSYELSAGIYLLTIISESGKSSSHSIVIE